MTSLDDLTLMQWFVSGDATLEANQSLRIQPANNTRQLLGRKGLLLATAYNTAMPPRIEVRRDTEYTNVLHRILIDHHFVPIGQELDSPVLRYAHYPIPEGYTIVYGQARQLWKQWWTHPSRLSERQYQIDLFVLAQDKWFPVRDIAINSGTLYIETLRGTSIRHGDDMVVWLEKDRSDDGDKTCFWAPPQAPPAPGRQAPPPEPAASAAAIDPRLAPVAYVLDGKVHVQTAVGLIIVEGEHLRVYSPTPQAATVGVHQRS